MTQIGIAELQKNSSLFSTLTEAVQIVDKRKKRPLAMVYPMQSANVVQKLSGKYKNRIQTSTKDMQAIKEKAMRITMEEKYGLSS